MAPLSSERAPFKLVFSSVFGGRGAVVRTKRFTIHMRLNLMNAQVPILIKEATCPSTWISLWVCSAATRCNTLQHAATRCNTMQHIATRCNRQLEPGFLFGYVPLQHDATHCNTSRHAATDKLNMAFSLCMFRHSPAEKQPNKRNLVQHTS